MSSSTPSQEGGAIENSNAHFAVRFSRDRRHGRLRTLAKEIKLCESITMEVQDELRTEINEIIGASAGPGPSSQTFASQSGAFPR